MKFTLLLCSLAMLCHHLYPQVPTVENSVSEAAAREDSPSGSHQQPPPPEARSEVRIPRLDSRPSLADFEGMALATELARSMAKLENFVQWIPRDGAPASQRTEAYLGYDSEYLYIVMLCFDTHPERLRARLSRREDIFRDDRVDVFLDTFNDQRRSYAFTVNPYGVQADATWVERESNQYDISFDTVWESDGRLTDQGYQVWIAIPFQSLRFPPVEEQEWGIILTRFITRSNEGAFWPHVSSRIEGRLNQSARLIGLTGISPGRNIQIVPYAFFRSFKTLDTGSPPRFIRDRADLEAGVDFKAVIRDSLVFDATLNPDFNQVESDEPQVTVNQRFEVFFPEKRPFFLENASFFETPINLFFSRRIADPSFGARLTGKAGGWAIGALYADDQSVGEGRTADDPLAGAASHYSVFRLNRDISSQSTVGLIFTDRRLEDSFNRVGGVDARIKFTRNWVATLQGVTSSTRLLDGTESSGPAYDAVLQRSGRQLGYTLEYKDRSPGFRTQTGFLPGSRGSDRPGQPGVRRVQLRPDIRSARQLVTYRFRPEGRYLIAWGPDVTVNPTWLHDGSPLDLLYGLDLTWELTGQTYLTGFYTGLQERLQPEDFPSLVQRTRFSSARQGFSWRTHFATNLAIQGEIARGTVVNLVPVEGIPPALANSSQGNLQMTWFPLHFVRIEGGYILSRLLDRTNTESVFNNHIFRTKVNTQFNRQDSLRVIVQYDTLLANPSRTFLETDKNLNLDFLFTHLVNPWTALYVGYNNNAGNLILIEPESGPIHLQRIGSLENDSWQFFVKFSYFLNF